MRQEIPYIQIVPCRQTPIESGAFGHLGVIYEETAGYHAFFAAKIVPEPYEILQQRKLGWAERDLLEEVLDRQGRFIASLHYVDPRSASPDPHLRTIALRYIAVQDSRQVDVILVGKVFAQERAQASLMARAWYEDIRALFSSDYSLAPLMSEEEFVVQSGQQLLQEISSPAQTAEVRRFELFLPRPSERDVREAHYLVYPFAWHRNGMEHVWQVMASGSAQTLVSITLRPAYLYEAEEIHLARFYQAATELAGSEWPMDRLFGEQAAEIYADYLRSWRQPFMVRAQIVALQGVPRALAQSVGCALSYGGLTSNEKKSLSFPGYELVAPVVDECSIARDNVCLLEMSQWGSDQALAPFRRFRYLADVKGALSAFRLPFLSKGGLPGVLFNQMPDTDFEG